MPEQEPDAVAAIIALLNGLDWPTQRRIESLVIALVRERGLMRPVAEALDAWVENPYHDRAESFSRLVRALKEWRVAFAEADATLRAIEKSQER